MNDDFQINEENLKKLYGIAQSKGMPDSYDDLKTYLMASEENRRSFYDKMASMGMPDSYEDYSAYIGYVVPQEQAPRVDVQDVEDANKNNANVEDVASSEPTRVSFVQQEQQPQHFVGNVTVNDDGSVSQMGDDNVLRSPTYSPGMVRTEETVPSSETQQQETEFMVPTEMTNENYLAVTQRGRVLAERRRRIQDELDGDTEMEPLTVTRRNELESQLRSIDEEMNGLSGFIDEWDKTDEARAYFDGQRQRVEELSQSVSDYSRQLHEQRAQQQRDREEKRGFWSTLAHSLMAAENPITPEVVDVITDPAENDLRAASNELRNARNQLRLEEMRRNGEMTGLAFLRGLETANYYELIPGLGMADAACILSAAKTLEDGGELSDTQKLLLQAMEVRAGVDFSYQDNNTIWERLGQNAPEQIAFTLQFVLGAALTNATNVGERAAARQAERHISRYADKLWKKVAEEQGVRRAMQYAKKAGPGTARNFLGTRAFPLLEGMVVSSGIQTIANPSNFVEDFERRYAGDIYYDNEGNLHVFDNDRSAGQAAYQAIAAAWIENFTEYAGENITKSAKLADSKMFDLAGKFDNVVKRVGGGKIKDVFSIPKELGHLTQIGSAPEEFLEEELGSVMNAMFATDAQRGESYGDAFKRTIGQSFSSDQQLETLLSVTITSMLLGGGGNAVNAVGNAGYRRMVNQDVERSKALLGKVHGIDIAELDGQIENGSVSDIADYLKTQSDANGWSQDEQGAAVSYVMNRTRQVGMRHYDDMAISEAQEQMRQQAQDMANRWDGQIYNATWNDENGEAQPVTIVNGRVHYTTRENGTIHFDPYTSSGMVAIRLSDGTKKQVPSRSITGIQSVMSVEDQLESQGQTIPQMMREQFEKEGIAMPTVESVWGGDLVANETMFENGKYTYLGQDQNGLYAFQNNDPKTSKDNPIVYMTERQMVEYGLSLNIQSADEAQRQKAQEDMDFMQLIDFIRQGVTESQQWDLVGSYAMKRLDFDEHGNVSTDSNPLFYAPYLLAIAEGSFENAIASIDQSIATIVSAQNQQAEATDISTDAAFNAENIAGHEHLEENSAKAIDFYTRTRQALVDMQQGQAEAKKEDLENMPVSKMGIGDSFPVLWVGQESVAVVTGIDYDGTRIVSVQDPEGNDIESGIDDMSDEQWQAIRVEPQVEQEQEEQTQEQPAQEQQPEVEQVQENNQSVEQETPAEQEPQNENVEIPRDKKGNIDYANISEPSVYARGLQEEFEDDAVAVLKDLIASETENLNKAAEKKDPIERRRAQRESQGKLDLFNKVMDILVPKEEMETPVEEVQQERPAQQEENVPSAENVPDWMEDTSSAARDRGFRMVNGVRIDRQEPIDGVVGNTVEVKFSDKEKPQGVWKVVESSSLQPSHRNKQRNPLFFITEAQPKERKDNASEDASTKIAKEINPDEVMIGTTAYVGSPVINSRGEVIQGNNRSIGLQKMYEGYPESSEKYKSRLMEQAELLGLDKESIGNMKAPVLVRSIDVDDATAIRLGQKTSQDTESGGKQRMGATQVRNSLGDKYSNLVERLFAETDESEGIGEAIERNGVDALKYLWSQGAINATQYQSALDGGKLTAEAKEDFRSIIMESLFEGGPDGLRSMFAMLPVRSQNAILQTIYRDTKNIDENKIKGEIQQAIMAFGNMMADKDFASATTQVDVERAFLSWKNQSNMFQEGAESDKYSNFALELAKRFKWQTLKAQRSFFNNLYDKLQGVASEGLNMFEEVQTLGFVEAIKAVYGIDYTKSQIDNGISGSNELAVDSRPGQEGGQGNEANAESGEQEKEGERPTDSGTGTEQPDRTGQENQVGEGVNPSSNIVNTIFTEDEYTRRKEALKRRHRTDLNIAINPQDFEDLLYMAGYHIERGVRKFADFCKSMIDDLGDWVRPYLQTVYLGAKADDDIKKLNIDRKEWSSEDEVLDFDVDNFDKTASQEEIDEILEIAGKPLNTKPKRGKSKKQEGTVELVASSLPEDQEILNDWKYQLNIDHETGHTTVERYTQKGRDLPLFDGRWKLEADSPVEMIDIILRSANGQISDSLKSVVETLETYREDTSNEEGLHQYTKEQKKKFSEAVTADMRLALMRGEKPYRSITDIRKRARQLGMEVDNDGRDDIMLQELVEDGLVRAARLVVESGQYGGIKSKDAFDAICQLYDMQPTISRRSSNRIKMQQYSTPLPMAFVADMFAYKRGMSRVLEPTAGNGMLVFAVPSGTVIANELDETRLDNLKEQGFSGVMSEDATTHNFSKIGIFDIDYDAVIANPPFGSYEAQEYDGVMIGGLEERIVLNSLASMKDNGRAAFIIGGNMEYAKNGGVAGNRAFWTYLYNHYNVKGVVDMAGGLYSRQGTSFPTRMILIEGRRSQEEISKSTIYPPIKEKALRKAETFVDLYDIVKELNDSTNKTNGKEVLRSESSADIPNVNRPSGNTSTQRPGAEPHENVTHGQGNGSTNGIGGTQHNAEGGIQKPSATSGSVDAGQRPSSVHGTQEHQPGDGTRTDSGKPANHNGDTGRIPDGGVSKPGTSTSGVGLTKPQEQEKRTLTEEKLSYRRHSGSKSLESVAPAAMVEAMDRALTEIEQTYGKSIDEFVREELGYETDEALHDALAAEQVDSVAMAIHQMKQGNAMIIGDQTGVGKGRQMAALIRWAHKQGKKPVFITQKANLFTDIYRDLVDIGSGELKPFIFNSDGAIEDGDGHVVYKPMSATEQAKAFKMSELPEGYDYAVLTYSQVNTGDAISQEEAKNAAKSSGKRGTKKSKSTGKATPKATFLRSISEDNYLFLDESHTAAGESNTGYYLQSITRTAKAVTFASATFAKRPDTMPLYAIRTAMSKANVKPEDLIGIISKGGVTLQEIMSRALTEAGQMVRRERDMSDVKTDWITISDPETVKKARENYDKTIDAFNAIIKFQDYFVKPMIAQLDFELAEVASTADVKKGTNKMGVENTPFASKTYNYTKQLMLALKVDAIVDKCIEEIKAGRHPVIALESTMEACIKDYSAGDVIAEPTFSASLLRGLETVMQYTVTDAEGKEQHMRYRPEDLGPDGEKAYYELQDFIRKSTSDIFISPLDAIIDKLHQNGYRIGELTGRNQYVERTADGKVVVKRRTDKDKKRMAREFNSGELDVLILNKSASTGISLHSSEKFTDQRQRTMIIAQPLSDINDYMQMIGRIDRTGQVYRGYYINLGLPVPAENRFLMMLATKLKSLNANTTTSQDSESNSVEAPDLLNKYGSKVVVEYLRDNPDIYVKMGEPIKGGNGKLSVNELDDYVAPDNDEVVRKITGYVALLSTKEQEDFYNDVVRRYVDLIKYLNDTGSNDLKITVMPLKAKTIDRKVSSQGVDPNGTNPFAKNAYVETVEIDVLRKPMKADEVRKTIESLNTPTGEEKGSFVTAAYGKNVGDRVLEIIGIVQRETEEKLKEEDERYEEAKKKAIVDIGKQREKIMKQQKRTESEKAEAIEKYISEKNASVESRHERAVQRINENERTMESRLRLFSAGQSVLMPDVLEQAQLTSIDLASPAIFCGIKAKDSNVTPSTTFAVFATLDGRRLIEIKLSEGQILLGIRNMMNENYDEANRVTLDNWDSEIPTSTRKNAFIMTGNILQAVADTQDEYGNYPGQLISYTDDEGNVHDGILMPDRWQPTMLRNSGVPINARLKAILEGGTVESVDKKVKIEAETWRNRFILTVPKTKKDGQVFFDNPVISNAVRGGFYERRGRFQGDIYGEEDLRKVVNELSRLGVKVKDTQVGEVEYSVRIKPAPKKTGIGYKVFVLKDGKLYPPMVANPNGEATPVGIWLDADAAPVIGETKTGRKQVKAGGKGTQGGSGQLSYRPGWHLGEIPYALQFNRKGENGEKNLFPKNFVWAEVEYANDVDYQEEAMEYGKTKNGGFNNAIAGLPRIPEDGSYRYRTNPNPQTDPWIITGAMRVNRILTPSEVDEMVREAGREPQLRESGAITDEQITKLNEAIKQSSNIAFEAVRSALANAGFEVVEATDEDVENLKKNDSRQIGEGTTVNGWLGNDGKIYLTKAGMNAETAVHEYTHLWVEALRMSDPKLWKEIKDLLKGNAMWNDIKDNPTYSKYDENRLAEEVLAHISGRDNAARVEEEARRMISDAPNMQEAAKAASVLNNLKNALKKFWTWVGQKLFGIKGKIDIDTVTNMVLADLVNGTNPFNPGSGRSRRERMNEYNNVELSVTNENKKVSVPGVESSDIPREFDEELNESNVLWNKIKDPKVFAAALLDEYSKGDLEYAIRYIDAWIKDYEEDLEGENNPKSFFDRIGTRDRKKRLTNRIDIMKKAKDVLLSLSDSEQPEQQQETEQESEPEQPQEQTPPTSRRIALEYNRRTGSNIDSVPGWVKLKEKGYRDWFDGLHPLEQMQQIIEKSLGRKLRDSEKAYELATHTTSISKAQMDKDEAEYMFPLLRKITQTISIYANESESSIDEAQEALTNYLLAKHGLERNEWFVNNGRKEGDYSGLRGLADSMGVDTDSYKENAESVVSEFEGIVGDNAGEIWHLMKSLTDHMIDISYESGMIDKDMHDELKARYKFYVPLRGFADGTAADIFDYIVQAPHFQDIFKKAKGRTSKADDPLPNLYNMLQSAIVIGNQNKVMQKIYNLAVNSKSDLLRLNYSWYVKEPTGEWQERFPDIKDNMTADQIDSVMKAFDEEMMLLKEAGEAKRKLNRIDVGKRVLRYQAKEHEMVAYVNGRKFLMHIAGNPVVAQALNKANKQQLGVLAERLQGVTRIMSMVNTSLSPAFMFTNAAKDIGMALFSATVTGGLKKNGRMVGNLLRAGWVLPRLITTGKMDAGAVKMFSKEDAAKIEQWWNEFVDNGGETGFMRTLDAEKAKSEVNDMIRHMLRGSKDGQNRLRKYTLGIVETMGRYSEDISRFAAYCLQRSQGESIINSVNEAKNITVNFNVKGGGRAAASFRACYSFFNASLQGINRMARLAKENPRAFAACLMACVLQGAALPWLNIAMFAMLGGDDDDWEKYIMLTEYTANHNLVLFVGNHKFIKIPYSQELAPFASMGNIWFRQQMGWNKGRSVASKVGNMFLDLSPVSVGESKSFGGKVVKTISPTVAKPFFELLLNEDFTGSPIYEKNNWNKYDAGWEKAYEGKTSKWLIDGAKWLDEETGIDINPAMVEHLMSGMLGGIGRSGDKLMRYFSNGFQLQDAPFIRTMMFDSNPNGYIGAVRREYGRLAYEVLPEMQHDIKDMDSTEFAGLVTTVDYQIANTVSMYKTGKDLLGNKINFKGIDKMEKEYKKALKNSDGSDASEEMLEAMKNEITEAKMEMLEAIDQVVYENSGDYRKKKIDKVKELEEKSKSKYEERNGGE